MIDPCIEYRAELTDILGLDWRIDIEIETANGTFPVKDPALWTKFHCTYAYKLYTTTDTDSYITRTISLNGATHNKISIKYKVASGTPGNGQIFYETAGHGRSALYYKSISLIADGAYHTLIADMSDLTAGGTDWIDNTIIKIYFDLTDNHPVVINLDWIGFTMQATGDPSHIEYLSKSDHFYDNPIKGSMKEFYIYSDNNFQFADLYSVDNMQYRVSFYYGPTNILYWRGYIQTGSYQEPYDGVSYPVKISATDGLGMLNNILYDDDGTPYNGRMLKSQIIFDILDKIGYAGFTEYVNIYEESMDDGEGDSPFDQSKIDVDIFKDMYCYEVLEQILKTYNAVIRQLAGKIYIFRPEELIGATVYGRIFTGPAIKTGTNFVPKQLISRQGALTDLRDVEGGVLMGIQPAKKVSTNLNCGHKESLIKNWQFRGETFDGTDFEDWTQTADTNASPISGNITEKNQGVFLDSYDASSPYAYYIHQTFGTTLQATADACAIEFDYLLYNNTANPVADVLTKVILRQSTTYYLAMNGNWVGSVQGLSISNIAQPGSSGWLHFKLEIQNGLLLSNTGITIELQASNKADVRIAYDNIRFYYYSTLMLRQRINIAGRERPSTLKSSLAEKRYLKIPKEITEIIYTKTNPPILLLIMMPIIQVLM